MSTSHTLEPAACHLQTTARRTLRLASHDEPSYVLHSVPHYIRTPLKLLFVCPRTVIVRDLARCVVATERSTARFHTLLSSRESPQVILRISNTTHKSEIGPKFASERSDAAAREGTMVDRALGILLQSLSRE